MENKEKLSHIQYRIGDQTLKSGCRLKNNDVIISYTIACSDASYEDKFHTFRNEHLSLQEIEKIGIIGSPVMIGDVLNFM